MHACLLKAAAALVFAIACVAAESPGESWLESVKQARTLDMQGDYVQAEKLLLTALRGVRKLKPVDHRLALVLINLGAVYHGWNRWEEGKRAFHEAIRVTKNLGSEGRPYYTSAAMNLLALYLESGNVSNAERVWNDILAEDLAHRPKEDPLVPALYALEGGLRIAQHKFGEAERLLTEALQMRAGMPSGNFFERALALQSRARARASLGKQAAAAEDVAAAIQIFETSFAAHHPLLARAYNDAAGSYRVLGNSAAAEQCYGKALEHANLAFGSGSPIEISILAGYAHFLRRSDRSNEAKATEKRIRNMRALLPKEGLTVDVNQMAGYR